MAQNNKSSRFISVFIVLGIYNFDGNILLHTLLRSTSELLCLNNLVCSFCKLPFWQSYLFWSLSHKRVTLFPFTRCHRFPYDRLCHVCHYDIYDILMPSDLTEMGTMYLVGQPVLALTCLSLLEYVLENLNE